MSSSSDSDSSSSSSSDSSSDRATEVVWFESDHEDVRSTDVSVPSTSGRQLFDHEVDEEFLCSLIGGASTCTLEDLKNLQLGGADVIIPASEDRPWRAPEGCFTVYEGYFNCGLSFPLPQLLLDYCDKRKVAISQLSPSSIHNLLTLQKLGRACGVEIGLPFFEGVTSLSVVKGSPALFYVKTKPGCGIICGAPNKIRDWKLRYFFVKKNESSVLDSQRAVRNCWNRIVDRRSSKLDSDQRRLADQLRDLSCTWFPKILESRTAKRKQRKPRVTMLAPGDDYVFDAADIIIEEEVTPPETAGDDRSGEIPPSENPSEQVSVNAEDPVIDGSAEQPSAGLPTVAEDPALPVQTEKKKKKKKKKKSSKRKRTEGSSDEEVSRSAGRLIDYKEGGFFEDKQKAAEMLYELKLANASVEGPPLIELEENGAYAKYARSQLRSQALLNKVIVDYQMKLTEARRHEPEASMIAKMRADIQRVCDEQMRSGEKLIAKSRECGSLRAELKDARQALKNVEPSELKTEVEELRLSTASMAEELQAKKEEVDKLKATLATTTDELASKSKEIVEISVLGDNYFSELMEYQDNYRRALAELAALGGYSKEVKARADRLRERLDYLGKVRILAKKCDQARAIVSCLHNLVSRGAKLFPGAIENIERDAAAYEAEYMEVEPVELEEGDMTPMEAYVPRSDRFNEVLGIEVSAELPETNVVQDPPADRSDEVEEGA